MTMVKPIVKVMFRVSIAKIEEMVTVQNEQHDKKDNSQKYYENMCEKKQ